jgi:hypothetical protein
VKRRFSQSLSISSKLNITYKLNNHKIAFVFIASFFLFNSTASFQNSSALDNVITNNTYSTAFGYLKLNVNSNTSNYSTEIYFNSNASQGLDPGYDSSILGGIVPAFSIYSYLVQNNTGLPFAIQSLSETDMTNISIPIGISANQGQEISVSIAESDIPESINIYFENVSDNTSTLLNNSDYNLTFDTNLLGIGNFYLRFEAVSLTSTTYGLGEIEIYMNPTDEIIVIKGELPSTTHFKLYDFNGRTVSTKTLDIKSANQSIPTSNLTKGLYIAELISKGNQKHTQKLIIH